MTKLRLALLLAITFGPGCTKGAEECSSFSSSSTGADWGDCGDGKARRIDCEGTSAAVCTCKVDDVVGSTFVLAATSSLGTLESATNVSTQCGWHITR